MFIAPPRYKLVVADWSQLELRILAHFCQDPGLMQAFFDDKDLHRWVAALVYHKDEEEVTSTERALAKNSNFAIVYGAGMQRLADTAKVPISEVKKFMNTHRKAFPRVW